jgi:hypothetical protein
LATAWLTAAILVSETRLRTYDLRYEPPSAKVSSFVSPELFKTLTFGQWPVGIDWMWLRTLTDSSLAKVPRGEHPAAFHQFMVATDLDPGFYYIYFAGANLLAVLRDDALGARELLDKGNRYRLEVLPGMPPEFKVRQWGNSWQLLILLAYVQLFELNDIRSAGVSFVQASRIEGVPAYIHSLAHRFEKPGGEYEVGMRLINFMIAGERDVAVRARLETRRQSLFLGQFLFHVRAAFAEYLGANVKYPSTVRVPPEEMRRLWGRFLKTTRTLERDPLGGRLTVDDFGRVVTSTPHESVFGLE